MSWNQTRVLKKINFLSALILVAGTTLMGINLISNQDSEIAKAASNNIPDTSLSFYGKANPSINSVGSNIELLNPATGSVFLAGVPQVLQFSISNNTAQTADVYATIGASTNFWTDARNMVLRPAPGCFVSVNNESSFTGSCQDLFGNNSFKVNGLAAGASVAINLSGVVSLVAPSGVLNELGFTIFSSSTNDFTSSAAQPDRTNVNYDSKYAKSLNILNSKVDSTSKFGGNEAFAQIQSPYNENIFAVVLENRAQVPFNNLSIQAGLDISATQYFEGCSFSQAQIVADASLNLVGTNLQGEAHQGGLQYTLNNLSIPASNGLEPAQIVFYVGCDKNSNPIPDSVQLNNLASVLSFNASSDSEYNLPQDLSAKAQVNGDNNLKLEKSLISKSTPQIKSGTEVVYQIKVSNTGSQASTDVLVSDIIQVPAGVTVSTGSSSIVGEITNPFQFESQIAQVVNTGSETLGLGLAFPVNSADLANTVRVFKVSKLGAGNSFMFNYKVIFGGTFPSSCNIPSDISNASLSFPVIRNIALLAKLDSGVNNGTTLSGVSNDISIGNIASFLKFNISLENISLTVNNSVLAIDSNLMDNVAVIDNTEDICDLSILIPPINSTILSTNDIPNLTVVCLPVPAGLPTICSFKLSKLVELPGNFRLGIGDSLPMASCQRLNFNPESEDSNALVAISEIVVCKNVNSPQSEGSTLIYAQIGTETRTLTGEKLNLLASTGLNISISPGSNKAQVAWTGNNGQIVIGIPEVSISLNQGDDLTSFEPSSIQVFGINDISVGNLISCSSYKLKLSINDFSGNTISSAVKEFKTTGCVDNKVILAEKTVPVSNALGGVLKLVTGSDILDVSIPAGFSNGDKQIQALKLDQTSSQINGLPKLPQSKKLAKNNTFELKAFNNTTALTTTFQQPISITMNYTDQDVSLLDPASLTIKSWDGTAWSDLSNCAKNDTLKTVTCSTIHFSIFSLAGQSALDTSDATWSFSPNSGLNAPIFKDSTPINIAVSNFSTSRNNQPNAGEYTCKFEFKNIKSGVSSYTQIATNVAYSPLTGCNANLTKVLRGNNLNLEFKATITSIANPDQSYIFTHKYFMLFRGSGIAFGQ